MFARPPVAKEFRVWVLDVLESLTPLKPGRPRKALPPVQPALGGDASDTHRRIREDLEMVTRIVDKLCIDAKVYLPQSGSFGQIVTLNRIMTSVGRVLASLYDAKGHLREANSLTLMINR